MLMSIKNLDVRLGRLDVIRDASLDVERVEVRQDAAGRARFIQTMRELGASTGAPEQVTKHGPHPVRFLTAAGDGTLWVCGQRNGTLGRFDPRTGQTRVIALMTSGTVTTNPVTNRRRSHAHTINPARSPARRT